MPTVNAEDLLPAVLSYKIVDVALVLAAKVIVPDWVMLLFDLKVIFPPLAPSKIAPDCVIPAFPPAAESLAITTILPAVLLVNTGVPLKPILAMP